MLIISLFVISSHNTQHKFTMSITLEDYYTGHSWEDIPTEIKIRMYSGKDNSDGSLDTIDVVSTLSLDDGSHIGELQDPEQRGIQRIMLAMRTRRTDSVKTHQAIIQHPQQPQHRFFPRRQRATNVSVARQPKHGREKGGLVQPAIYDITLRRTSFMAASKYDSSKKPIRQIRAPTKSSPADFGLAPMGHEETVA